MNEIQSWSGQIFELFANALINEARIDLEGVPRMRERVYPFRRPCLLRLSSASINRVLEPDEPAIMTLGVGVTCKVSYMLSVIWADPCA